jgi:hypothetical protein
MRRREEKVVGSVWDTLRQPVTEILQVVPKSNCDIRGPIELIQHFLVFNRVYRLELQSVMLVFSTAFVNYCPSNLLSG